MLITCCKHTHFFYFFNTKLYKNGGKYKKSNKMDQKIKENAQTFSFISSETRD